MTINLATKNELIKIQKKEITEYVVYGKISRRIKGKNSEILKEISEDELKHYNQWKKYTDIEVTPNRLTVIK